MDEKKLISVADASYILRVSERQIRRYCNEGRLICFKEGKAFEIEYDSVLEFLKGNFTPETSEDNEQEGEIVEKAEADIAESDVRKVNEDVRIVEENVRTVEESSAANVDEMLGAEKKELDVSGTYWTSRTGKSENIDMSDDISVMSDQVRTSIKAVTDESKMLIRHLTYERKRNMEFQVGLVRLLHELQIPMDIKMRRDRRKWICIIVAFLVVAVIGYLISSSGF